MKHFSLKNCFFLLIFLFNTIVFTAQNSQNIWSKISKQEANVGHKTLRKTEPLQSTYYQLNISELKKSLSQLSNKTTSKTSASLMVEFPNTENGIDVFKIQESSILEPKFQDKHSNIRTYIGKNTNNPSSTISFSVTPQGLHAMMLSSKTGTQFIDPYSENNVYVVYNKGDLPSIKNEFECLVQNDDILTSKTNKNSTAQKSANDSKLRTFRLALASTIEYSQFHWQAAGLEAEDSQTDKKAAVLAAMTVTMNRVNTIFQRDLAIKMILVDNTDIIFIDSDSFSNNDGGELINQSQTVINNTILSANYDIGHTFSTGGGGIASLNSPCNPSTKAMGVTGLSSPVGDAYDIDYVSHEMGHQFGATHTFNSVSGNCASPNRTANTAYEPGSGNTIMAYAGICAPDNIQSHGDAYFHQKSIEMIWDNITSGTSTCGVETSVSNNAPIANAGPNYTIPISTAFKLVGSSTDLDGTATHTYTWEQYDLGPAGRPEETNTSGPLVRSVEGTTNPVRNIPNFADYVASGGSTTWEKIPAVNRTLTFALTVRDNDVIGENGAGQTDVDFMNVIVNSTEPFAISNPVSWAPGSTQNIEWNVGQTADVSTINCQSVSIKLSTDGGLTFPTIIAASTPNDGSFTYTVPAISNTTKARILIEALDNIFYDISDFDFSISNEPDFFIVNEELTPIDCKETEVVYNFDFVVANGYSENTTFSATNIPGSGTASFSPANLNSSGNVVLTISNLDDVNQNDYNITIAGSSTESSKTKNKIIDLPFYNSICASSGNTEFQTSTTRVDFNTIANATGKTGYSDFTGISTDVVRETDYDLSVRVNTDGAFTVNTKVWIDWNQDCDFNDAGETYNLGDASNTSNGLTSLSARSITIPTDAVLGQTLMRVSTKYKDDGEPSPCENSFDGETEDYTLNILANDLTYESSINLVSFNTINQVSDKSEAYADFTTVETDINRDSSYDLTINVSTETDFTSATKVWFDWNQNSRFDDEGEAYDLGSVTNATNQATSNSALSITIPIDAVLGKTIMRVATIYAGDLGDQEPTPSGIGLTGKGEIEDYTVNLLPTLSIETFGFENLLVYPNPNMGDFNVKLNGGVSRNISVEIFNLNGQRILNQIFEPTGDFLQPLHLDYLQSGMYILNISDGLKSVKKKIIIN